MIPTLTPMQFIWTVVAISVAIIMFILYHMMLTHKHKKKRKA